MISVRNLSLEIGRRRLLDGISFDMDDGRIYALLGANGSGKTTLIRVLTSCYEGYDGCVVFDGRELRAHSRKERADLHSLLPQTLPHLDMDVEALLSLQPGGLEALDGLGLGHLRRARMSTLSGGERQMVFLALSISRRARLYAFDEPESSLDAMYRERTESTMKSLGDDGGIVLVSLHDINRALLIADGLIVLSSGRLAFSGSPEAFLEEECAEKLFGLRRRTIAETGRSVFI